jgi:hypothetical protein
MINAPYQELPSAKRRWLIFRTALRSLLLTAVLVVLYYVLPLDERLDAGVAVRLLIGFLIFAAMATWQVRSIVGSRYPAVKAIEALGLIFPLYLLLFASTYFVMERASAANFTQPLTRTDALYFAVTVFSTVDSGTSPPSPSPPGWCSSFSCLATWRCWAPACGYCWAPCAAASSEDPIRAAMRARLLGEGRPGLCWQSPKWGEPYRGRAGESGMQNRPALRRERVCREVPTGG